MSTTLALALALAAQELACADVMALGVWWGPCALVLNSKTQEVKWQKPYLIREMPDLELKDRWYIRKDADSTVNTLSGSQSMLW